MGYLVVYGYVDTAAFVTEFLRHQHYKHVVLFRDESYECLSIMADVVLRVMRGSAIEIAENTVISSFSSALVGNATYLQLRWQANEKSRGKMFSFWENIGGRFLK